MEEFMARKHRITNVLGLGSLPLIKRDETVQPRLGLKKFTEEYNREQQAAKEAPQRALDAELREEFRLNTELVRAFFGLPMQELDRKSPSDAPCDFSGDYPLGTVDRDGMLAARNSFLSELSGRGVTLSPEGATRFGRYFAVLVERRGVEVSVAAFFQALDRCVELGIFAPGEISGYQPRPKPQIQQSQHQPIARKESNLDELLRTTSSESRTGRATLVAAVNEEVTKEYESAIYQFLDEVKVLFDDTLTDDERKAVAGILTARNWNANNSRDWHRARVLAVRAHYVRETFLNPDEKLSWDLDRDLIPLNTFADRQAFNRRVAGLHGKTPILG
jgi:hypothetical protein